MKNEIKEKYKYIRFSDFETTTANTNYYKETGDSRVNLWTYTSLDDGDIPTVGTDIKTFIKTVINDVNNFDGDFICIYFHNLKFDIRYIWTFGVKHLGWKIVNGKLVNPSNNPKKQNKKSKNIFDEFDNIKLNKQIFGENTCCIKFTGKESKPAKMELLLPNNKRIIFLDSLAVIPMSLEQLGEIVNIGKHNNETLVDDFYDVEPQDEINKYPKSYVEYAIRDCLILKKYFFEIYIPNLEKQQDRLEIKPEYRLNEIPLTIANHSIKLQRAYLESYNLTGIPLDKALLIDENQELLARKFYLGGLTLFNPNDLKKEYYNCCYIDINSSYPYSMTKPIPFGGILQEKLGENRVKGEWKPLKNKPDGVNGETYLTLYHIKVKSAKIINKLGLYPLQDWISKLNYKNKDYNNFYSTSCIDYIKNIECYYLDKEWELMKQFYDFDYEIVNTYYIRCCYYLRKFIETLYKDKCDATNPGERNSAKLLLNSGYGKWGENPNYDITYFCANKEHQDYLIDKIDVEYNLYSKTTKSSYYDEITGEYKDRTWCNREIHKYKVSKSHSNSQFLGVDDNNIFPVSFKKQNRKAEKYNNVWIAAIITAYSRCYLLESILKCGNEIGNVLYCDTDSMILKDDSYLKNLFLDDKKLGAWKIENENITASVFGKKLYKLKDSETGKETYKLKGVSSKKAQTVDALMQTSKSLILASKLVASPTPSGWVLVDKNIQLCTNPIHNQMKNAEKIAGVVSFNTIDEIEQMRHMFDNIREIIKNNKNIVMNYQPSDDIWKTLQMYSNELSKLYDNKACDFQFNFNKEFLDNNNYSKEQIRVIILATINNFLLNSNIESVENTNLIDVLDNKINVWKSNNNIDEMREHLFENHLSFGTSGDIVANLQTGGELIKPDDNSSEWIFINFKVYPQFDECIYELIKMKTKSTDRKKLVKWLVDNEIFKNTLESSNYLNWCLWKSKN